ncbi:histidine kinase [Jiangella sp. DSM 45060]|uniref:sensor histidine kinase n=1 Tax=Jiangella sp. DSM 45060 TaxID=1798224 RepID=UPI00087B32C9|nr:histidine kinase [Jiangella sp. DSM 45060]SDS23785.1 Histidine kinase-, DNA gyrase B-, and HSP90-like ATPase [Jiangella sp. DSM 45060]
MPDTLRRTRAWVATAIAVAAWALAVLSTVLLVLARPPLDANLWFFVVDVTVAGVYGTVAAITLRRRLHPVPILLAVAAVGGGLAGFGYAFAWWSERPGGPDPIAAIADLQGIAWVPGTMALFLVVPWLVRDHPLGLAWAGVVAGAVVAAALSVVNVVAPDWPATELFAASVVLGLVTAAETEWRHRRGPEDERNGLGWLALGTAILAVSFVPLLFDWDIPYWSTPVLHLLSQAVFPAAVLVAVLRNQLWGLGLAVRRTVLAGLLTSGLLALYLVVALLVGRVVPGQGVAQLVAAGSVAVAVQPLRMWLATRVHRLVHGPAADPAQVVRLGSHLGDAGSVEDLLRGLAEDIGRSMRLESVRIEVDGDTAIGWGRPTTAVETVTLVHRGEEVGRLELTVPPGEALDGRAQSTLRDLAAVVATAVAVARAAASVDQLRDRVATARLEERRVIRREIHDGLGPSLAGLRLGLQGARNLLDTDVAAGKRLLGALQAELDQRVDAVRTLSHHLLPPVLDELGLAPALEELVTRYAEDGIDLSVCTQQVETLSATQAAAAYGIVSEALANVSRHANARRAWVEACPHDGGIRLTIADDGAGVAPDAVPGVGSRSMRERAAEQSGYVEVGARDGGGTVVLAWFPSKEVAS